jgi:hypothetical protein
MFLPSAWFTPVLPPTEESTWDITVVGTYGGHTMEGRVEQTWLLSNTVWARMAVTDSHKNICLYNC